MGKQGQELARVADAIGATILDFRAEVGALGEFCSEELRQYVIDRHPSIAPDSPSRILRMLRLNGDLNYVVIDRSKSLYQFTS